MKKKTGLLIIILASILMVYTSCDTSGTSDEIEKSDTKRPWSGQEWRMLHLKQREYDTDDSTKLVDRYDVTLETAGNIRWYYIDAKSDMTYTLILLDSFYYLSGIVPTFPTIAEIKMTAYKENAVIFAKKDPKAGLEGLNFTYYSPYDQKLYISFEFLTSGSYYFYHKETDYYYED